MSSKPICPCKVAVSKALGTGYCPQLAYPVAHSFCDTMTRLMPGEQSRALIRKQMELRQGAKKEEQNVSEVKAAIKNDITVNEIDAMKNEMKAWIREAVAMALPTAQPVQPTTTKAKATKGTGKILKDAPVADAQVFQITINGVVFTCRYAGLTKGRTYAKYDAKLGQDGNTGYISGIGIPIK